MKKGLLILATAIATGILAFFLTREKPGPSGTPVLLDSMPELAWLGTDLGLTPEQLAKVGKLHREYRPVCDEMCRRITESEANIAALAAGQPSMTEELAAAIEKHGHIIAGCKRSMLEHLYQTAAFMDGHQARRYLEITVPLALESASRRGKTRCHD